MKYRVQYAALLAALLMINLLFYVMGCSPQPEPAPAATAQAEKSPAPVPTAPASDAPIFQSGTYRATAHGHHSDITAAVTFSETALEKIEIVSENDSPNIADTVFAAMPAAIIEHQSLAVDGVASATFTSNALRAVVKDCISQAGGEAALEAFNKEVPVVAPSTEQEAVEVDVVVVGSGLAGISAACSAAESGAKVALLEKLDFIGGTSQTILGGFRHPVSDSEADKQEFVEMMQNKEAGLMQGEVNYDGLYPEEALARLLADNGNEDIAWLEGYGAVFSEPKISVIRGYASKYQRLDSAYEEGTRAYFLLQEMVDKFEDMGGALYLSTPATELIQENGAVVGVKAKSKSGKQYTFRTGAVILASGGYGNSKQMIAEYCPAYSDDLNMTLAGNTGDGIRMALAVGAVMYDNQAFMSGNGHLYMTDADMMHPYQDMLASPASLYVGPDGIRRHAEDFTCYTLGPSYVNPDAPSYYWIINTESIAKEAGYLDLLEERLAASDSRFFKAEDIASLARKIKITPNTLRYTINRYNALCEAGEDTDLLKAPEHLVKLTQGPYYAVRANIIGIGTLGGIQINSNAQVLDANANPIPGLYAAGEICIGGFFNLSYTGAFATHVCVTLGRVSGKLAAAQ